MNKKLRFTGGEPDITEDNLLRDSDALYEWAHELGNSLSGGRDMILQGCVFTKNAGVDASVTAGYVYDATTATVVKVDAQTVPETIGTTWELVYTTTYDSTGDKTYVDGTPRQTYQVNRMVLTNVASVSNFDVENADSLYGWRTIPDSDILPVTANVSVNGSFTLLKYNRSGNKVSINGMLLLETDGSFTPSQAVVVSIPDSYFTVKIYDGSNNSTFFPSVVSYDSLPTQVESAIMSFKSATSVNQIEIIKEINFTASITNYRIPINVTVEIE